MNPRSYASIQETMRKSKAKSRGQLMRQMVEAFREPVWARRAKEAEKQEKERQEKKKEA